MISLLKFDTLKTALVLMSALLATDVLWVFATDVMVTVASSLDIPIKIVIPISTIRKILFIGASPGARAGSSFLGLGDIVIPGIFISFCLIVDLIFHDEQLSRGKSASKILKTHSPFDFKKTYFHTSLIGYCLGLAAAFYLANAYKTGQPALLYLVPSTAVPVGLLAYVKGQLKAIYDLDTVAYYYPEGTDVGDKSPSNKSKKTSGIPDDAEPKSVTKSKTRKKALQKHEYASSEASSATLNGTRKQASQGRKKGVSATA